MDTCVFCQHMSDGSLAQRTIYEDHEFLAFLDANPLAIGHTQLIPKTHVTWVWEYADPGRYFDVAARIATHLQSTLGVEKVDLLISGGSVPHAHMHLIPSTGKWLDVLAHMRTVRASLADSEKDISGDLVARLRLSV